MKDTRMTAFLNDSVRSLILYVHRKEDDDVIK